MDKFSFAEILKDLINNRSTYEVKEYDEDSAELTVKVGKKQFVIQIKEI